MVPNNFRSVNVFHIEGSHFAEVNPDAILVT